MMSGLNGSWCVVFSGTPSPKWSPDTKATCGSPGDGRAGGFVVGRYSASFCRWISPSSFNSMTSCQAKYIRSTGVLAAWARSIVTVVSFISEISRLDIGLDPEGGLQDHRFPPRVVHPVHDLGRVPFLREEGPGAPAGTADACIPRAIARRPQGALSAAATAQTGRLGVEEEERSQRVRVGQGSPPMPREVRKKRLDR
jgi:hypothetical protein